MTTTAIRQQLHSYLEVADDSKIKAFYTLMKSDIEESGIVYTEDLKKELDDRYSEYQNGQSKLINAKESKSRIDKIIKKHKSK